MWNAKNMVGRAYLILAVLFSVVGVVQCVRWADAGTPGRACLLNFLPATAFSVAYVLSRKWRRKVLPAVAIPLCLLVVSVWGLFTVAAEQFISATTEVTDVRKYDRILTTYWESSSDLVSHFPRPIPADAQTIRFSFVPAFLQGGAHVQLRCSLPPEQIEEWYARFARKKTKSFFGGDMNDHMNMKNGMPTTCFYAADTKERKFPNDYEIMVLDDVLNEEDRPAGFYWNHGRSHGVAISRERHEIVFWAESW